MRPSCVNPLCLYWGHHWAWSTDTVACSRHGCRETSAKRTEDFLSCFDGLEAQALIARELNRAEMGTTTDSDPNGW